MIVIRQARDADDAALAAIDHACWSPLTDPGPHWAADRPFFGEPTDTDPASVLVAQRQDDVVGFIKMIADTPEAGHFYIGGFGVVPDARREGIGARLVAAALTRAEAARAKRVWLKVLGSNNVAISLYQTHGFVEYERFPARFHVDGRSIDDVRLEYKAGVSKSLNGLR